MRGRATGPCPSAGPLHTFRGVPLEIKLRRHEQVRPWPGEPKVKLCRDNLWRVLGRLRQCRLANCHQQRGCAGPGCIAESLESDCEYSRVRCKWEQLRQSSLEFPLGHLAARWA